MTGVRIRDLGPLEVERAGAAQAVGGARIEAALALLLIHAGQAVSTDALAEAMWGDQDRARSATTLDSHVWRLRKLLEPERAPGSPPTVLLREPGGYRLVVAADRIDSVRYAALAAEAGELLMHGAAAEFSVAYARVIDACLAKALPLVVCTIYNGNFSEFDLQLRAKDRQRRESA